MAEPEATTRLPENAYRELKPGEEYIPMVPPNVTVKEVTTRSVLFGLLMNVLFAMAATFLALRVGQGIETAIPISILAVGLSGFLLRTGSRSSSLLENVNILAIGTTSGIVAGGTVFTMPAIYVLKLQTDLNLSTGWLFLLIFLVPFLGAVLGVLFLVPFRRYFVKDMHGKLPFPEATATNEILVTGAGGGGGQAIVLIYSLIVGFIFNWLSGAMKLFTEGFTTAAIKGMSYVTNQIKAVFSLGTGAEFVGLGFIIGVRYASIIVAGSLVSWFVIIPLFAPLGLDQLQRLNASTEAHHGPLSDEVAFTIPAGLAEELNAFVAPETTGGVNQKLGPDMPEDVLPLHRDLRDAFAANGVTVDEDAVVTVRERGQMWSVAVGSELFVAKTTEEEGIAVFGPGEEEPRFRLEQAWADKLDRLDLRLRYTEHIAAAFTDAGVTFRSDAPKIEVAEAGQEWNIKDTRQSYVLKAQEATNDIAVHKVLPGAEDIFFPIPRNIGIGCIFTAGLLSILKMSKVIVTALSQALGGLAKSKAGPAVARTDEDISYPVLFIIGLLTVVAIWVFFRYAVLQGMPNALSLSIISLLLALGVAFIFTTVSAWAIAMISVTPISGMTVTTIIITAVVLLAAGLPKTPGGMLATLLVGGVVAAALSMAGTLVTEFKIGYWLGASPKKIQWSAIIASVIASAVVTGTIMILAETYGYDAKESTEALQAPQANMMASALQSFIGTGDVPWIIYGTGVVMALLLELVGVSPLAFGLGMYLPMELNAPILVGALVAALVRKGARSEAHQKARNDRGILIASGLIAGAAISGVVQSLWKLSSEGSFAALNMGAAVGDASRRNWLGLIMFLLLCLFVFIDARRAKPAETLP